MGYALDRLRELRGEGRSVDSEVLSSVRRAIRDLPAAVPRRLGKERFRRWRVLTERLAAEKGLLYEHAEAKAFEWLVYELACEELNAAYVAGPPF